MVENDSPSKVSRVVISILKKVYRGLKVNTVQNLSNVVSIVVDVILEVL